MKSNHENKKLLNNKKKVDDDYLKSYLTESTHDLTEFISEENCQHHKCDLCDLNNNIDFYDDEIIQEKLNNIYIESFYDCSFRAHSFPKQSTTLYNEKCELLKGKYNKICTNPFDFIKALPGDFDNRNYKFLI